MSIASRIWTLLLCFAYSSIRYDYWEVSVLPTRHFRQWISNASNTVIELDKSERRRSVNKVPCLKAWRNSWVIWSISQSLWSKSFSPISSTCSISQTAILGRRRIATSSILNQLFQRVALSMPKTKPIADFQLWYKITDVRSKTAMLWSFLRGAMPLQPQSVGVCVASWSFALSPFSDCFAGVAVVCDTLVLAAAGRGSCSYR